MRTCRTLLALVAVSAAAAMTAPQDRPAAPEGNYVLSMLSSPTAESRMAIVKFEAKDGAPTVSLVHDGPPPKKGKGPEVKVGGLKAAGGTVSFAVERYGQKYQFEGSVDPKDPKRLIGTLADGDRVYRGSLERTDLTELTTKDMVKSAEPPAPLAELTKLRAPALALLQKAAKSEDKGEQKAMRKEARAMLAKVADEKAPDLYRRTVEEHPDSPHAVTSASSLLSAATKLKAPADEVAAWAKVVEEAARPYGPKFQSHTRYVLAETLGAQEAYAELALKYAGAAATDATLSTARRAVALQLLAAAQERTGKADLAAKTRAEAAKLDLALDEEYERTVPPFRVEKYAGRKDGAANRVAVLELFTGAQCPPCVAADAAFDGVLKAYAPADVVLLQYHVHIPGPDPLTNADTVARFEFYADLLEEGFGGAPSTAFNGRAAAGGGGSLAAAEGKYDEYRKLIDGILEQTTDVRVAGTAKRDGDKVAVSVEVAGPKDPKPSVKLRLVLAEGTVRYTGGNGVRVHHNVVRSVFGGAGGVAVKELKDGKHSASLDLADLRAGLRKYLDKYHAEDAPFPRPGRPLELKGLKVVALVQDDESGEVLQAAQFDLGGE